MMEITEAIQKLKKGKSPGPGGLTAEYYKYFEDILSEKLKDLITGIMGGTTNPWYLETLSYYANS